MLRHSSAETNHGLNQYIEGAAPPPHDEGKLLKRMYRRYQRLRDQMRNGSATPHKTVSEMSAAATAIAIAQDEFELYATFPPLTTVVEGAAELQRVLANMYATAHLRGTRRAAPWRPRKLIPPTSQLQEPIPAAAAHGREMVA